MSLAPWVKQYESELIEEYLSLNSNSEVISYLEKKPDMISWEHLSENPNAVEILKKNKHILDLAKRTKIPHIVAHLKNYFWHSFSLNPLRWQIVNVNFGPKKETLHYAQKCLKFLNFYSIPYKVERKELLHSLKLHVKDFPRILKLLNNKQILKNYFD
jgi:hypothetical protein